MFHQDPGSKKNPNSAFPKDVNTPPPTPTTPPITPYSGVSRGLRVTGTVAPKPVATCCLVGSLLFCRLRSWLPGWSVLTPHWAPLWAGGHPGLTPAVPNAKAADGWAQARHRAALCKQLWLTSLQTPGCSGAGPGVWPASCTGCHLVPGGGNEDGASQRKPVRNTGFRAFLHFKGYGDIWHTWSHFCSM